MESCEIYQKGFAKREMFLGSEELICPVYQTLCPYGEGVSIRINGGITNVCVNSGQVEKSGLITSVQEVIKRQQNLLSI